MFEDINKLKYFKKAEAEVAKAGYGGFLIVDRTKFAITGRKNAKIYFLPITRKGNKKKDKIPDPKGSGTQHIGFLRQCLNIFYESLLKGDMTYDVT